LACIPRAIRVHHHSRSDAENCPGDRRSIGKIRKNGQRLVPAEFLDGIPARGDADRARAERSSAGEVGGSISDDDDRVPVDIDAEVAFRAIARDRRKVWTLLVVGYVGTDVETLRIQTDRPQLRVRATLESSGTQPDDEPPVQL